MADAFKREEFSGRFLNESPTIQAALPQDPIKGNMNF